MVDTLQSSRPKESLPIDSDTNAASEIEMDSTMNAASEIEMDSTMNENRLARTDISVEQTSSPSEQSKTREMKSEFGENDPNQSEVGESPDTSVEIKQESSAGGSITITDSSANAVSPEDVIEVNTDNCKSREDDLRKSILGSSGCSTNAANTFMVDSESSEHIILGPVKRRPGRPPGSTKNKMNRLRQCISADGKLTGVSVKVPTDYSLRRFYEAGGRDYNEYLEWLKQQEERDTKRGEKNIIVDNNGLRYGPLFSTKDISAFPLVGNMPITHPPIFVTRFNCPQPPVKRPSAPLLHTVPYQCQSHHTLSPSGGRIDNSQSIKSNITDNINLCVQNQERTPSTHRHQIDNNTNRQNGVLDLSSKRRKTGHDKELQINKHHRSEEQNMFLYKEKANFSNVYENIDITDTGSTAAHQKAEVHSSDDSGVAAWDVESVARFVSAVPGCQEYVEVFKEHRIDGATLPHLSEEHLLNFVKMKLGPAIRLLLEIQRITKRN